MSTHLVLIIFQRQCSLDLIVHTHIAHVLDLLAASLDHISGLKFHPRDIVQGQGHGDTTALVLVLRESPKSG